MHRLLALRARLRRGSRHIRADHSRPRIRLEGWNGRRRFPVVRMRVLRRLRAGVPDRDAQRKAGHRKGNAGAHGRDDLRLLRRRLLVQGGAQGRRSPAHGSLQGRQGQRGPFLRQGPVRLRLRDPQGPHSQADDPRADRGSVARSLLGRRDRLCGERIQAHSGEVRARLGRRDQLLALHQRGSVPGSEDGSRRVRQQQHRHLRARLPLADRLRPLEDLRHLGRHAGFQVGRQDGCRGRDRRQSDRRPSGFWLSHEEAPARRRASHRHRSPPHRSGQEHAHQGRLSSRVEARNQCRGPQRVGACHRHRGPRERGVRPRPLRLRQFRVVGALRRRSASFARGDGGGERRRSAGAARGRASLSPPAAMARSITGLASPSTARARPRSWRSPTSPWRPETSAAKALA